MSCHPYRHPRPAARHRRVFKRGGRGTEPWQAERAAERRERIISGEFFGARMLPPPLLSSLSLVLLCSCSCCFISFVHLFLRRQSRQSQQRESRANPSDASANERIR